VLKVLEGLYPPILDVPFFSHTREAKLNKSDLELIQATKRSYLLQLVKGAIPQGRVYKFLRYIYWCFSALRVKNRKYLKERVLEVKLRKFFINFVNQEQERTGHKIVEPSKIHHAIPLVRIAQYLHYINKIIKNK